MNESGYKVEAEYTGIPKRRFRFDWAIPELRLAVEYEGLGYKSRHTSTIGYSNDCRKYNLSAINGWLVLRYTSVTYKEAENEIKAAIKWLTSPKKEGTNG